MLCLNKEVSRKKCSICSVIGNHHALGGAKQHHGCQAVALHFHLGQRDSWASWAHHLAHLRNGVCAETKRSNASGSIHTEHIGDAQQSTHHENGGVYLAVATGNWWNNQ